MLISKKFDLALAIKKNYLGYFFILLFCIAATTSVACSSLAKKAVNLSSGIPFNYPGLRIETRSCKPADLEGFEPLIACFGDSVTFGWNLEYKFSYPAQLEAQLREKYTNVKVINSGVGGNTVIDGIKRLKRDIISYNPDTVIINFGLNDGMLHKSSDTSIPDDDLYYSDGKKVFIPAIAVDVFENKYTEMLGKLKSLNINTIVLGITPITEGFNPENNIEITGKQKEIYYVYNERVINAASAYGFKYIDLAGIFAEYEGGAGSLIQPDGIHPESKGLKLIADILLEYFM